MKNDYQICTTETGPCDENYDHITYPFMSYDREQKLKQFIVDNLRKDSRPSWPVVKEIRHRGKIMAKLFNDPDVIKWDIDGITLDIFMKELEQAEFPKTQDISGRREVCVKSMTCHDEGTSMQNFKEIIDSFNKTKSPKKVILPRSLRKPNRPVGWRFVWTKPANSYFFQSIFFGPWFTYLHVDEYNHGKKMSLPAICRNSFKLWFFLKKNTHRQTQFMLREHKVLYSHGETFEDSEYKALMKLVESADKFEVFIQRPGDMIVHDHGIPHAVLTCFFDSTESQYSLLFGINTIQAGAIISHISHPYSEMGREVRPGVKSYKEASASLLGEVNRLIKSGPASLKNEAKRLKEEHKYRKKRKRQLDELKCAKRLKGICKMRKEAKDARNEKKSMSQR
jgi:hypothetical protein